VRFFRQTVQHILAFDSSIRSNIKDYYEDFINSTGSNQHLYYL
jgi:hypothetical protein